MTLAIFLGLVALPAQVSRHQSPTAPDYRKDTRFQRLLAFFESAGCPAKRFTQAFLEAADRYKLDWRLLPSLSFVESTGGKAARNNNLFGWGFGKAHFPSPVAGIETVANRLALSKLYRNKTLDEILATYNPDVTYGPKVKWVMSQISALE
jgi:hypothetical protein